MPHTKKSSSGIPTALYKQQEAVPEKRAARAMLARRHPLTPREIAHVCTALLRIAEQLDDAALSDIRTQAQPD